MQKTTISALLVLALLGLAAAYFRPTVHSQAGSPTIELISVGTDGIAGNGPSGAGFLSAGFPPRNRISADGRYVVFESEAFNLVCSDTNFSQDIFVRDRHSGAATLVSVTWNGAQANDNSFDPALSADGRYAAFESAATNLVPGDTNGFNDIFLRDLQAGTTTRVSVSSTGEQANSVSHSAAISANGRYVAFFNNGSNLVPNDTNNTSDVFVHDRQTGTTERVSVSTSGEQGTCCRSVDPSISADGRYVAFLSQNRFAPPLNNNTEEVFVRDRQAGTTTLVSLTASGGISNTGVRVASISADGRYLAFQSNGDNIVTPDQNGFFHDIFLRDMVAGTTTLVSVASDGTQGNRDSFMPSISGDGRYVTFHSWSNNLVPGDTNTGVAYDVFLRDTLLNTTMRLSVSPSGAEANGNSTFSFISEDGSLTYFQSSASNLVSNEHPNGYQDVFLYGPPYPGAGDPGFQFNSSSYSVAESGSSAIITVTRTGNACGTATIDYATSDGTATNGLDYTSASGTLTFPAGETSKTFSVAVINDALDEPDETVNLSLSNPTGGTPLGNPFAAVLTILDDDASVNSPPNAANDSATTDEDNAVTINVLANDTDAEGDALTISNFTQGANGAVVSNGDGTVTYTPQANFNGSDSFTYQAKDPSNAESNVATVNITVSPVNDAPGAVDDAGTTAEETAVTISVLANDTDADGDALLVQSVTAPANGAAVINADGSVTYTPNTNFSGTDLFTYTVSDGNGGADTATVNVTITPVNDAPDANEDAAISAEDTAANIKVLANDTDADGDSLSVQSVTQAANGSVSINADGTVTYTPAANFNGSDTFTYTVSDGNGGTDTATVSVIVSPVNDAPVANGQSVSTDEDTASAVTLTATDADGDALTYSIVIPPAHGSLSGTAPNLMYTPAANYNGPDSFTFKANDGSLDSNVATVNITVSPVNDAPDSVDDLSSTTAEDTPVTVSVLANDTDADGDALSVQSVTQPANGTAVINADGTVTYTPNTNFPNTNINGTDSFTYTVSDGHGGADTATVNLKIIAVNDAPEANEDAATSPEDTAANIKVLANDTDADGDSLSVQSVTQAASGLVSINADGRTVAYRPLGDFNGSDTFTYTVSDGNGGTDTATVSVSVSPVNDAPFATDDSYSTSQNTPLTIAVPGVLGNDGDVDGTTLTAVLVSGPASGVLSLNPDGSFTYTPNTGFTGTDSFTYMASDGAATSNPATVTIVVNAVSGGPYKLIRAIIAGGGSSSSGGGYALIGTIGQHDAVISGAGPYRLEGGFWPR